MRTSMSMPCIALIMILLTQFALYQCENENDGERMESPTILSREAIDAILGDADESMKLTIPPCNHIVFEYCQRRLLPKCWCCFNESEGDKGCFYTQEECLKVCPPYPIPAN
ncbi:hypothetical protein Dimus_016520 [Dionaea muscipula]